ncbi:hypothetical protein PR202_gb08806 [Eleusine coracana subsp. coracana]|uniref:Uncharacterized protein n=1 Tax=Eleusine coracana subsp. coracana TaxID=191504 RepID=A0AAV5EG57_ELECO|nr:hypothetical protein PR202_gb08806 [Eleusine coracana subsp. coracana]
MHLNLRITFNLIATYLPSTVKVAWRTYRCQKSLDRLKDPAARAGSSSSGNGVVPVRECVYAALFALNVATCFGECVDAMRVARQEFLDMHGARLPCLQFATFKKVSSPRV